MTYTIAVCTVKTPDDGQRNCPKHVEFYSKSKFEKLVHLVGFIIIIYHDVRSPERQNRPTALYSHYHTGYDAVLHGAAVRNFRRNCPKHVAFYSKNKFEKLAHLIGFIVRIYHDARSPESQNVQKY
jgi:hypothetical protein